MSKLDEQLAALATMSPAQLRDQWQRLHRTAAPALTADLLRLGIAYRLQERAVGGLSRASAGYLRRGGGAVADRVKPGTRLVRSWNGRTITVLCDERGFQFENRRYRSLSAIAREVTSTAWSGPRFFGLVGANHG